MEIDHIFIFSNTQGSEADDLVRFGLTEGSNRIHKGQGTTNRKFYFENFFLEVLWVSNHNEINQSPTLETDLAYRANFMVNKSSRYGLCFVNTEQTDKLFKDAQKYQPNYFPQGMAIDILPNKMNTSLPWTFRLPHRGKRNQSNEPTNHKNQIKILTKVEFSINTFDNASKFTNCLKKENLISFVESSKNNLILEFDNNRQDKIYHNKELELIIKY